MKKYFLRNLHSSLTNPLRLERKIGILALLFAILVLPLSASANDVNLSDNNQSVATQKLITGIVSEDNGMTLPGVSIIVKGSTNGTTTDIDGKFQISVPTESSVLVFSFIGMLSQEITVGSQSTINVVMLADALQMEEVVVTALGIKREVKSLGYAFQEVKGDMLTSTRESNLANTITGKVAGLQIIRGSNGPASSSKIVLRGFNSLTGDNQPLIIIDGVPMDNFTGASNNDYWNPSPDMGNGLGDINPENIESLSVLKGASAAALYGSRAGNGVILITTKSGKAQKGLGVTYSTSLGIETNFMSPKLQNTYGQGIEGTYDNLSGSSWGPRIEGQDVEKWDGQNAPLQAFDNLENYSKTGVKMTHTLSFQQQVTDATSVYSSLTYLDDDSKIPGAKLNRLNLLSRAVSHFGEDNKWTTDVKVQYIKIKASNRPIGGPRSSNAFSTMYLLPRSLDITDFRKDSDADGNMQWYASGNSVNPYWAYRNNLNTDLRDRFLLNGMVKREFTDWLSLELKAGADLYTTSTENKLYAGSPLSTTGRYSVGKNTFMESNYSALLSAAKDNIFGKFGGSVNLGGNLMQQKSSSINANAGELEVPNLFSINNGKSTPSASSGFSEKRINSLYGTLQLNYDGFIFVDITGRNDWSSTLSKANRSFFYPSVSTSLVVSEMVDKMGGVMPQWMTFGKIRGSYAQVGNDMSPYQLYNSYNIGKDPNGNTTAERNSVLFDDNVKSELIKSWEFGVDARFFNNRLGIDFTWYKSNATNQLINIPLNPLSGYSSMKVNAGDIENKGYEIMVNARILDNPKGLNWDLNINYSKNTNTINELTEGVTQYGLGGFDNLQIIAIAGERYGTIYGTKFRRVEDKTSSSYGKKLVNGDGLPLATSDKHNLGNQQPDALIGFSNNFSYKNFSLSFLIDARIGGEMFSGTNLAMQKAGTAAATAVNGARDNFVVDGVLDDATYTANTKAVTPQLYWQHVGSTSGNLGISENNIYDATNIRIRNIELAYSLPSKWLANSAFQGVRVGLSCNNVWMLKSYLNGVDPESVYATGSNAVGFENLNSPTSRTYNFNVVFNF